MFFYAKVKGYWNVHFNIVMTLIYPLWTGINIKIMSNIYWKSVLVIFFKKGPGLNWEIPHDWEDAVIRHLRQTG